MRLPLTIDPHIKRKDVIRRLGGREGQSFSHSVRIKLQNSIRKLYRLMNPRLFYLKKRIKLIDKGCIHLKGSMGFKSSKLSRTLRDCDEVICFITTVGGQIDSEISNMMREGHLSEAYVIDALGSVAVESVAEQFQRYVENECRENSRALTPRFSPGYCDWPLTEQKKLFGLFDSNMTGIELKDSCLMIPRKSISGVFGIYPFYGNSPPPPFNPCRDCSKLDCPSRRA